MRILTRRFLGLVTGGVEVGGRNTSRLSCLVLVGAASTSNAAVIVEVDSFWLRYGYSHVAATTILLRGCHNIICHLGFGFEFP